MAEAKFLRRIAALSREVERLKAALQEAQDHCFEIETGEFYLRIRAERRQLAEALKAERALVSCYKLHTQPSDALLDKLAETHEVAALAERILKEEE